MTMIEVNDEDLSMIESVLKRCDAFFDYRDRMNAEIHEMDVRYSPITLSVDRALNRVKEIRGVA